MGCCGGKRKEISKTANKKPMAKVRKKQTGSNQSPSPISIYYEYSGRRGLIVVGSTTNKRYFFAKHGSRLAIDGRDRASLDGIPSLQRV